MSSPKVSSRELKAVLSAIESSRVDGRSQTNVDRIVQLRRLAELGGLHTLEPLLPLCLNLSGEPYDLSDHYPFSPLFKTAMPQTLLVKSGRQVSKSSSLASSGVMLSNAIPYLKSLYICPLYESIRRFSNNYVRPFINNSPVKSLWTGTSTENSVLQRTFKNNSLMLFSFAFGDCDRIRGISADLLSIDESVYERTPIISIRHGVSRLREIKNIIAGDLVVSYDMQGRLEWQPVITSASHGRRACFLIRTKGGHYVIATADHYLATYSGWRRVSQIIEGYAANRLSYDSRSLDAGSTCDGGRNLAGGRVDEHEKYIRRQICIQSWVETGGIQLDQVPHIIRIRKHSTQESEEQRLRGLLEHVYHGDGSGLYLLVSPRTSTEHGNEVWVEENDHYGAVTSHRRCRLLRRTRLVDRRRRKPARYDSQSELRISYGGIHVLGGGVTSRLDDTPRNYCSGTTSQKTEISGALSTIDDSSYRYSAVAWIYHRVCASTDAIQGKTTKTARLRCLCFLQGMVRYLAGGRKGSRKTAPAMLWQEVLSDSATSRDSAQIHGATRPSRNEKSTESREVLGASRDIAEGESRIRSTLPKKQSRGCQSIQAEATGKDTGNSSTTAVDVSAMQSDGSVGAQGHTSEILRYLSCGGTERDSAKIRGEETSRPATTYLCGVQYIVYSDWQHPEILLAAVQNVSSESAAATQVYPARTETPGLHNLCRAIYPNGVQAGDLLKAVREGATLTADEIVEITYAGQLPVWDIEVANTHTYVAGTVAGKNCQDFDPDHYPVVRECMSHSSFALARLTGTPKSTDNFIEGSWQRSSQAEWFIPCYSCGRWNIPSIEFHLDAMIGPYHDEISEACPATVCYHCRRPIFPRHGHWVHRYPQRRWKMAGYHVPQLILPLHYANPDKWAELRAKREGWGNTTQAKFYNEVLGESVDAGQKLISETEMRASAILPWRNDPNNPSREMLQRLPAYQMRVLAVDWGGGGEEGVSFTTIALLGFTSDGRIDVLWGKRLVASQEHLREAREVLHWVRAFRCHLMAHDYTGAGVVRETVMVQAGFDLDRVLAMQYVRAASSNLIRYVPSTVLHNRAHYRLDKTRSLLYTFQAIKLRLIRSFQYDYVNDDNPGLLHDFLALVEEKTESRLAGDIYTITRNPMLTDDFAQAVNIGCAAIWHANDAWPNYAEAAAIGKISSSQILATGSADYGWDEDRAAFFDQP